MDLGYRWGVVVVVASHVVGLARTDENSTQAEAGAYRPVAATFLSGRSLRCKDQVLSKTGGLKATGYDDVSSACVEKRKKAQEDSQLAKGVPTPLKNPN